MVPVPSARPRVTLGAALTLGSFALFAPAMLFPALVLLLWTSPPPRASLQVVLGIGAAYALISIALPGGIVDETMKAWVVIAAALFVPLVLRVRAPAVDLAVLAALLAAAAVLAWYLAHGIPLQDPLREIERDLRAGYRLMGDLSAPERRADINEMSDTVVAVLVPVMPGLVMLIGVSALLTAWRWYHLLAPAPLGEAPPPFREFRFTDHFLWILVAGMAGLLAQARGTVDPAAVWPANLLIVSGALYLARGLAVVRWRTGAWSGPLLLVAFIAVLFLAPLVFTGLFGIGLADTWLDFRRAPAPAPGE